MSLFQKLTPRRLSSISRAYLSFFLVILAASSLSIGAFVHLRSYEIAEISFFACSVLVGAYLIFAEKQSRTVKALVLEKTKEIEDSNTRLRALLETLPQRIIYKDQKSVFVSCNNNFARDFGLLPKNIAGKTDYDFYPPSLAKKYVCDDMRVMELGEAEEYEERHFKDNQELIVKTVKTPFKDQNGRVIGILAVFWDITESKRKEEALRASEERLAFSLDATKDGLYDWNLVTDQVYFSAHDCTNS